jgi:hypothetical protein
MANADEPFLGLFSVSRFPVTCNAINGLMNTFHISVHLFCLYSKTLKPSIQYSQNLFHL